MNRTEESFSKKKSSGKISQEPSLLSSFTNIPKSDEVSKYDISTESNTNTSFFGNNTVVIVLIILLIFPAIGLIILSVLGNTYKEITESSQPIISNFLKLFGYSTGTIINTSADVAGDAAKVGIDILEGSVHNVGNLVQGKTGDYPTDNTTNLFSNSGSLDSTIQKKVDEAISKKIGNTTVSSGSTGTGTGSGNTRGTYRNPADVSPDNSDNKIQNPISSGKAGWCLTGEYQNKRGCVSVSESDQCLSGQIFPSKEMCLNPTLTP